jgi:hypothetical protein
LPRSVRNIAITTALTFGCAAVMALDMALLVSGSG